MVAWLIPLLIGLALNVVAYLIMPKPKAAKPEPAKDLEAPVAESGKPVQVLSGTMTMKGMNIVWYGDRGKREYKVAADGAKK